MICYSDHIPSSVTFSAVASQMPEPTVIIGGNGGVVKERGRFLRTLNPKVFMAQKGDWIDISAAQQRTMLGLVHIALNKNPFCDILFLGASSIWGTMILKDNFDEHQPLTELLRIPVYDIRKVLQRKWKRHDIFREKRA